MALMLENGFDERPADPDQAIELYKKAIKLGSSDAAINLALVYLNVTSIQSLYIFRGHLQRKINLRQNLY